MRLERVCSNNGDQEKKRAPPFFAVYQAHLPPVYKRHFSETQTALDKRSRIHISASVHNIEIPKSIKLFVGYVEKPFFFCFM
jgi:hypothetical protein